MVVFEIDPLPDFLADHTLAGDNDGARLDEHCQLWVQFVSALWVWKGKATFAIRFVSEAGHTRCFLVAVTRDPSTEPELATSLEALMLGARLLRATDPYRVDPTQFAEICELPTPFILDRAQLVIDGLWEMPKSYQRDPAISETVGSKPPVTFPWGGPAGGFSIPMALLVSHPRKSVITAYIAPEDFPKSEVALLAALASAAKSEASQIDGVVGSGPRSRVNAGAEIAGNAFGEHLRRLQSGAFLSLVQVAVEGQHRDVAESLVAGIQAAVIGAGQGRSGLAAGPGGSQLSGLSPCIDLENRGDHEANFDLYRSMDLNNHSAENQVGRLQMLTDATGAATIFRFPVSIRSGIPGVEVRQFPPDHHHGRIIRERSPSDNNLLIGEFAAGGLATIPVNHLARHALIVGFTGSGKTVTALSLLHQLSVEHAIPWLVLESSKQEYRGLTTVRALRNCGRPIRVYTLGNDTCLPFRLNPFELLEGVRVESHISRLQVCFEAAVPMIGPAASVIHEALCRSYETSGWALSEICRKEDRGTAGRRFPTLAAFIEEVKNVIRDRGYMGEVRANVEAAVVGRFQPLVTGSKGLMFDTAVSNPPADILFEENIILEMNDLNIDDKALTVMFLLTLLREYREVTDTGESKLRHVTLIEEAHNVMADTSGGDSESKADTRGKAVEALCNMLAEIRSFGQGVIIADQSPQKLARDAIRNTNLQISHQLRDGIDRETMASAMIMDDDQELFLGKLEIGHAGVFWTGREKAGFVRIPNYSGGKETPGYGFSSRISDVELKRQQEALFGGDDLEAWTEWYLLVPPKKRREMGMTLNQLWQRAADLTLHAIDPENLGVRFEVAWLTFAERWRRLTRLASTDPAKSTLTEDHKLLFRTAIENI